MQGKKRTVIWYSELTSELKLAISKAYPHGFKKELMTVPKSDGTSYKAFTLDKGDTVYLIKVEDIYLKSADELLEETENYTPEEGEWEY